MLTVPEVTCLPGAEDSLMTSFLPELVGDPSQLLGDLPQAAGGVGVVGLLGGLHPLGCAPLLQESAGPEELTALDVGSGGAVQRRQSAFGRRLGHEVRPLERGAGLQVGVG